MAQIYGTGPAFIYVGLGAAGAPLFLGTTEKTPNIQNRPTYKPVYSDSHGQEVPADVSYQGQDAIISARFTRFNYATLAILQSYTKFLINPANPGTDANGSRGALMLTEGLAYNLWIRYPFSAKVAMQNASNGPLPPGRRYIAAHLITDNLDELGTNPLAMSLAWHCLSVYFPNALGGYHVLYDQLMTNLPAPT